MADLLRRWIAGSLEDRLRSRLTSATDTALRRPAVVIAPHQDDEVLGCGGTILRKRDLGAPVTLVFLTDGGTSHRNLMPSEEMRPLRRAEALEAAARLGVPADRVHFLDIPNRELTAGVDAAAAGLAPILAAAAPAEIYTPWAGEPPPDHAAAYRATVKALALWGGAADLHEYAVWFWQEWPWCRAEHYQPAGRRARWAARLRGLRAGDAFRTGVNVEPVLARKRHALAAHRSQNERLIDDPAWGVLADVAGGEFLARLLGPWEIFKTTPAPPKDS
ncbi:MAG TPA: PIG-L family deacetylase [Candidatus Krumholzibacteria bacterium]|mgnify:CR=1 FL=1|nr:PIG-L family deacetylase [Candidatus Krumholzibacteria bacterium]HRX51374.1 PIG-L family deacetylase [Candidatus Krumholzibacteria bacterium]